MGLSSVQYVCVLIHEVGLKFNFKQVTGYFHNMYACIVPVWADWMLL